ncbi:MAG: hypothetical protein IT385_27920 [Deltaproteobacteria bacterium]|nr:hypothetical protein [Deltaproteobacteria bacterium]
MKRALMPLLGVLLSLNLATLTGCSDECGELADLVCDKMGEQDPGCQQLRKKVDQTSNDDKRACAKLLTVASDFTPKK